MDFHSLSRRELQSLCKKNKIPANITNVAMADALASLTNVEGLEEIGNQETVLQSPQTCRSARTRPTNEIDSSSIALSRPRRGTIRKNNQEEEEKENKDPNVMLKTPASRVTGRRRAVAVGGLSVSLIAEEKEKSLVVTQVYSTRRSTRLSEKKASELVPKKVETRNEVISMSALSEEESDDIVRQFASDEKEKIEENKGDSVEISEVHSSEVVSVNDQLIPDETPVVEIGESVDGIQVADSAVDRDLAVRNCTAKDNTNWESEELTLGDADASSDVSSLLSEGGGISVNPVAPSTPEKTEGKESNEIANQDGLYTSVSVDIHCSMTGFGIEQLTPEKTTHSEANNNVVSCDASDADAVDFESSSAEGSLSFGKIDVAEDYQILESGKAGDLGSNVAAASKVSGEIGSRIESSVENPPLEQHTNLEFYLAGSMEPLSCENVKSDESVLMASSVEFSVELDVEKSATDLLENDYLSDDDWEVEIEVPVETEKFIRNEDGDVINESIGSRTPISYSATDSIVSRVPVNPNNTPASASRLVLSQNMVTPKSSNKKKSTAVSKMVLEVFDEDKVLDEDKQVNNTVARSLKNKSRLDIMVSAEDTPTAKTVKKVADDNKENNNSGGLSLKNKARVNEVVAAGEKNTKKAEDAKKALENKSLRVLKKLYKEKLANANNVKEEFLEKARPALQILTENCLDGREN